MRSSAELSCMSHCNLRYIQGLFLTACLVPKTKSSLDELESQCLIYRGDLGICLVACLKPGFTWMIIV